MDAGFKTIRIEAANRWDAFDLLRRLTGFRTHLIQENERRWLVCVREDRDFDLLTAAVVDEAARWSAERQVATTISAGDRSYALRP